MKFGTLPFRCMALSGALLFSLAGCGGEPDTEISVSVIDESAAQGNPFARRAGPSGEALRHAVAQGLVTYDAEGRIVPGLAERWIVTDDGQSYIFRLRDTEWREGAPVTGEQVVRALRQRIKNLARSRLTFDLASVRDIRSMTGRVVEIRLHHPKPDLLQVLAQPELGIWHDSTGTGPLRRIRQPGFSRLEKPGEAEENGKDSTYPPSIHLFSESADRAIARYQLGHSNIVLGGLFQHLPLLEVADINRTAIRLDPVGGLFGLSFVEDDGFLSQARNREAISMAIDRDTLLQAFNIDGWQPTTLMVGSYVPGLGEGRAERWDDLGMEERRAIALARITNWQSQNGPIAPLRIALPKGLGSDLLFQGIQSDLARIGMDAQQVAFAANADLRLVDDVAIYASPTWYLGQLSCVRQRLCDEEADFLLTDIVSLSDSEVRSRKLFQAYARTTGANYYIPLASPLRWSLARPEDGGFVANATAWHPLSALLFLPN